MLMLNFIHTVANGPPSCKEAFHVLKGFPALQMFGVTVCSDWSKPTAIIIHHSKLDIGQAIQRLQAAHDMRHLNYMTAFT